MSSRVQTAAPAAASSRAVPPGPKWTNRLPPGVFPSLVGAENGCGAGAAVLGVHAGRVGPLEQRGPPQFRPVGRGQAQRPVRHAAVARRFGERQPHAVADDHRAAPPGRDRHAPGDVVRFRPRRRQAGLVGGGVALTVGPAELRPIPGERGGRGGADGRDRERGEGQGGTHRRAGRVGGAGRPGSVTGPPQRRTPRPRAYPARAGPYPASTASTFILVGPAGSSTSARSPIFRPISPSPIGLLVRIFIGSDM